MKQSQELQQQQEAAFREKAAAYIVCFQSDCPLSAQCLRWQVGRYVPAEPLSCLAVNPRHEGVATRQCPMFRDSRRVVLKLGLTRLYDDMPARVERAVRQQLYQEFGRKYYFEMRKGLRPITPDQQQVILSTCRRYGWQGPVVFDAEQDGWVW